MQRRRPLAACLLLSLPALAVASTSRPAAAPAAPAYDLSVRIMPDAGTLEGRVEIVAPGTATFALSRDLRLRRVLADGHSVNVREGAAADGIREVALDGPAPHRLTVEYAGRIDPATYPRLVSQVNGVHPSHVELAGYVGWYPQLKPARAFRFRLSAQLPPGFAATANGSTVGRHRWQSRVAVGDVVLFAAPGLQHATAAKGGFDVAVDSTRLPREHATRVAADLAAAAAELASLVKAPSPAREVHVVFSPRPGWGYVRAPLIVLSEESALAARDLPFGPARDLRYATHEIAHYWWRLADTGTPEDWLNEGLAEYSAWLVARRNAGGEFAAQLLREYRERSADSATTTAIVETPNGSPDREVNRYARPVLLLEEARERAGDAAMAEFLPALYARFSADARATTAGFLEVAAARLGAEATQALADGLHRKSWGAATRPAFAESDTPLLGTWAAKLTQGSETHEVVLHLAVKDGALAASIDSPDQGVRGVPVPSVRVAAGRLRFGLGAFGVSYEGALTIAGDAIAGTWTQGGVATPLTLSRVRASGVEASTAR